MCLDEPGCTDTQNEWPQDKCIISDAVCRMQVSPTPTAVECPESDRGLIATSTVSQIPPPTSSILMPATRSTTKRQRITQTTRQNTLRQDRHDYYKCGTCGGLFSRYHGAHKRHIQLCETRNQDLRDEEAQTLAERYTPTPEPYTQISSSAEVEFWLGVNDHGAPDFECCLATLKLNGLQILLHG